MCCVVGQREQGYDLFGEEKGYVLVQEMRGVDQDASSPTQFYIETTDTYRSAARQHAILPSYPAFS